jgi:hypothetical protein
VHWVDAARLHRPLDHVRPFECEQEHHRQNIAAQQPLSAYRPATEPGTCSPAAAAGD